MEDEPTQQHNSATRASLYNIAVALAHLWLSNCFVENQRLPTRSVYWIYGRNLGWGNEILTGKRIRVTIEIEEDDR